MYCHILADVISLKYPEDKTKTTMRDMPWNKKVLKYPLLISVTNKFYAISQLIATGALITTIDHPMDISFAIMMPIQIATFLMTLVRKNIIGAIYWHIWYSLTLMSVFFVHTDTTVSFTKFLIFVPIIGRLVYRIDKYILWSAYFVLCFIL